LVLFGVLLLVTMRFFRNGLLQPAWQRLMHPGASEGKVT